MSRLMLATLIALPLCGCSTAPQFQSSYFASGGGVAFGESGLLGPTSVSDPRLRDPHFYMDDDGAPRWFLMLQPPGR